MKCRACYGSGIEMGNRPEDACATCGGSGEDVPPAKARTMTSRDRAEETFTLIRALKRMDASMIPVIEHAIDEAVRADREDRTKSYARCQACRQMELVRGDGRIAAHVTRSGMRCNGEGHEPWRGT